MAINLTKNTEDVILEGINLIFVCQVVVKSRDVSISTVSIKWTLDGSTIENRGKRISISEDTDMGGELKSTLTFGPVYRRDAGIYICFCYFHHINQINNIYVYIYIYIYIQTHTFGYTYIYIYIYTRR